MAYTRDPRIAKLPQWAQSEFSGLERKVAELEDHIKRMATVQPEDSNATLDPYSDYSIALPANPMIRHHISRGSHLETKFDGRKLNVRGVADSAFDDFLIIPSLSNEIVVEFRSNNT